MELVFFNKNQDTTLAIRAASLAIWRLSSLVKELKLLTDRERNEEIETCDAINVWDTLLHGTEEAADVLMNALDALDPHGRADQKEGEDPKALEKAYKKFSKQRQGALNRP